MEIIGHRRKKRRHLLKNALGTPAPNIDLGGTTVKARSDGEQAVRLAGEPRG